MRNNDPRSRCIAILPDMLVNGHLLAKADSRRQKLQEAFVSLDKAGFGIVQLPPDELPVDHARASLDFALDQIADYLKHGYRLLHIELDEPGEGPAWRSYLDQEIRRRALTGIEEYRLQLDEAGLRAFDGRLGAIRQSAAVLTPTTGI